jgi:hypothetical protein
MYILGPVSGRIMAFQYDAWAIPATLPNDVAFGQFLALGYARNETSRG